MRAHSGHRKRSSGVADDAPRLSRKRLAELGRTQLLVMNGIRKRLHSIQTTTRKMLKQNDVDGKGKAAFEAIAEEAAEGNDFLERCLSLVTPSEGGRMVADAQVLLKSARRSLHPVLEGTDTEVKIEAENEASHLIRCIPNALRRAILEIAENGIEAMEDSGGTLKLHCHATDHAVVIRVEDEGVGMDPDVVASAFEPFYSNKRHRDGLGLSIAKKLVEEQQGRLALKSSPGESTTVTVRLPKVQPAEAANEIGE
jgi:signal transduction histidine kinase